MKTLENSWTTTDPNRTPQQVAQHFADECYPGRKIELFEGNWFNLNYAGRFRLVRGNRWYAITADHYGNYEIAPE